MKDLFNFDTSEMVRTSEKGKSKAIRREMKQKLQVSKRDENANKLMEANGGFPKSKEYLAIKTSGETDAGSFFSYALDKWEIVDEMYLATWTISIANINRITESIKEGKLKKLVMVFSSTLKPANPSLYSRLVSSLIDLPNVSLKEVNSHAKTFSISNGKDYITISGSANWSKNPRIENYLILNDKELFEHHKEWMSELQSM